MPSIPKYRDLPISAELPPRSSWNLWGPDDQFGTLNHLSDERTRAAAALVRTGSAISLNAALTEFDPPLFGRAPVDQNVESFSKGRVRDETLSSLNTQASSQWDGFRHVNSKFYGFYNGLDESQIGISAWAQRTITGRGVLLDAERYFSSRGGLDHSKPVGITADNLRELVDEQGISLQTGDVLILHTGWMEHARSHPDALDPLQTPGLQPSEDVVEWLWDSQCAAIGTDTPALEVWPPGASATDEVRAAMREDPGAEIQFFMHSTLIALLGLVIGELWDTKRLAAECAAQSRSDFLFASAPLTMPNGVASPANALAIL